LLNWLVWMKSLLMITLRELQMSVLWSLETYWYWSVDDGK